MNDVRVLSGVVAVDLTQWIAGPYLTRLLADLGARVIKIEPPEGDTSRRLTYAIGPNDSGLFQQLNAGKESACLDLTQRSDRLFLRKLAANADLLIHDFPPVTARRFGISYRSLARSNPRLIMCSLSGFGQTGLLRDWEGSGGVAASLSGARDPAADPAGPPQGLWGDTAAITAGTHGLSAVLTALYARGRGGPGQHIDISSLDCFFGAIAIAVQQHLHATREGKKVQEVSVRLEPYRTRNGGYVLINAYNDAIWRRFTITIGHPELAEDEIFDTSSKRMEYADAIQAVVQAWFDTFEAADDVLPLLHAARVPAAVIATTERAWRDPQLRFRGMFAQIKHPDVGSLELPGCPLRFSNTELGHRERAPALGEHTKTVLQGLQHPQAQPRLVKPPWAPRRQAPFEDLRVLDFSRVLAGPYLGRHLRDLGAQVIKVEPPKTGDDTRALPYLTREGFSGYFMQQNCGKLGISLDLKRPDAIAVARQLASLSDIVLENYKPGVMAELGLSYDTLRAHNPSLIMCSISGYGQTGPYADRAGEARSTTANSGQIDPAGDPEGPPQYYLPAFGDINAGSHALVAIAAALWWRDRTGEGQYIDLSILDCLYAVDTWNAQRYSLSGGTIKPHWYRQRHPFLVPRGDFPTADGRWLFLEAYTDEHWRRLAVAIGMPGLAQEPRFANLEGRTEHQVPLYDLIAKWVQAQPSGWTAEAILQAHLVPGAVVRTIAEGVESSQIRTRSMLVPIAHPSLGEISITNSPYRFSGYRTGVSGLPPSLGEHNRMVMDELLGLPADETDRLEKGGVLYQQPAQQARR